MNSKTSENILIWLSALAFPTFATFILFNQINKQKERLEFALTDLAKLNEDPHPDDHVDEK